VHTGRSWLCPPAAVLTVARNWVSSLGKLAVYSSFIMYMYSGQGPLDHSEMGKEKGGTPSRRSIPTTPTKSRRTTGHKQQ